MTRRHGARTLSAALYLGVPAALIASTGPPRLPNFAGYNLFSNYLPPDQVLVAVALACWTGWGCAILGKIARSRPGVHSERRAIVPASGVPVIPIARRRTASVGDLLGASSVGPRVVEQPGDETGPAPFSLADKSAAIATSWFRLDVDVEEQGEAPAVGATSRHNVGQFDAVSAPSPRERDVAILRCLGPLSVERGSRIIRKGWRAKTKEMLAYLCAHPEGGTKGRLVDILWPDAGAGAAEVAAEAEFKRATSRIRAQVRVRGEDPNRRRYVIKVGGSFRLESESWWVDAWEFGDLISRARDAHPEDRIGLLHKAIDLYRGEFCSDCYYAWVEPIRERFRRMFVRASMDLAELLAAEHREREALAALDRVSEQEPTNEQVCCLAMRIEESIGRSSDAIERFSRLTTVLEKEIGVEPSAETMALVERLNLAVGQF